MIADFHYVADVDASRTAPDGLPMPHAREVDPRSRPVTACSSAAFHWAIGQRRRARSALRGAPSVPKRCRRALRIACLELLLLAAFGSANACSALSVRRESPGEGGAAP